MQLISILEADISRSNYLSFFYSSLSVPSCFKEMVLEKCGRRQAYHLCSREQKEREKQSGRPLLVSLNSGISVTSLIGNRSCDLWCLEARQQLCAYPWSWHSRSRRHSAFEINLFFPFLTDRLYLASFLTVSVFTDFSPSSIAFPFLGYLEPSTRY